MVLAAYGDNVAISRLRAIADHLQGTSGYDDGIALDYLQAIAQQAGLRTEGLTTSTGRYRRWSMGDVISEVRHGYPVITLVHYASLPDHATSDSLSDHFIVVVGVTTQGFVINDPAYVGNGGYHRVLRADQLLKAWADASIQDQAAAFLPPNGPRVLGTLDGLTSGLPVGAGSARPPGPPPGSAGAPLLRAQARPPGPPGVPPDLDWTRNPAAPTQPAAAAVAAPGQVATDPGVVALAAQLQGWKRAATGASPSPTTALATPTVTSASVGDPSARGDSPLPAVVVVLVIVGAALVIVKAPRGDSG